MFVFNSFLAHAENGLIRDRERGADLRIPPTKVGGQTKAGTEMDGRDLYLFENLWRFVGRPSLVVFTDSMVGAGISSQSQIVTTKDL